MTEAFKNLQIDTSVNEEGVVSKIVFPLSNTAINFTFDDEGGINEILDDNGEEFAMEPIGVTDLGSAVYDVMREGTEVADIDTSGTDVMNAAKIVLQNGDIILLEFNEKGVLKKETNPKYESIYLLNKPENAADEISNRIDVIFAEAVVVVREYTNADGETIIDESLFGNIINQVDVADL